MAKKIYELFLFVIKDMIKSIKALVVGTGQFLTDITRILTRLIIKLFLFLTVPIWFIPVIYTQAKIEEKREERNYELQTVEKGIQKEKRKKSEDCGR